MFERVPMPTVLLVLRDILHLSIENLEEAGLPFIDWKQAEWRMNVHGWFHFFCKWTFLSALFGRESKAKRKDEDLIEQSLVGSYIGNWRWIMRREEDFKSEVYRVYAF